MRDTDFLFFVYLSCGLPGQRHKIRRRRRRSRARLLDKELGIRTLGDMLRHYPFRYIDRTKVYRIARSPTMRPPCSSSAPA